MKLGIRAAVWHTGPDAVPAPLVAALEVSGAVLMWTLEAPSAPADPRIAFTDTRRADWLWRVLGPVGHAAVIAAGTVAGEPAELDTVAGAPQVLAPLRRLALGHWMRRWWPVSRYDAIAALDAALLDGEIALGTAAAQEFFTDDTLDSDVAGLLAPHLPSLQAYQRDADPRVAELARRCAELAADLGVPATGGLGHGRRDEYALAAGIGGGPAAPVTVARGRASIPWAAVPPGVFDAAEDTVGWAIRIDGPAVQAEVSALVIGPGAAGMPVRLRTTTVTAAGFLDDSGRAVLPLELPESDAWNHDWTTTVLTVGLDVDEAPLVRDRIREFARARLAAPATDAYLAETLAAESDY